MPQRSPYKFLLSLEAIQVHLLGIGLIVVLSISLWQGNVQPDYKWALLFVSLAYPTLLGLLWLKTKSDAKAAKQFIVQSITDPAKLRRNRIWWRRATLMFAGVFAALLVIFGERGLRLDHLPAQYLGYFLLALTGLGAAGINIWRGGPLDLRLDPPTLE